MILTLTDIQQMVVEITPIGIQSLAWRFYIIWTVFNFAFVPIVYFFYPETAGRTLEDIDRFFTENQDILIFRDKDATSNKRPARYAENEEDEVRRNSSVSPQEARAAVDSYRRATLARLSVSGGSVEDPEKKSVATERFE